MSSRAELEHFSVSFRFGSEAGDRVVASVLGHSREAVADTIENRFIDKGFFRWEEGGKTFSVSGALVRSFIVDESPETEQRLREEAIVEQRRNAAPISLKDMS
jgi:GMP synthase PP-ATPase subunit